MLGDAYLRGQRNGKGPVHAMSDEDVRWTLCDQWVGDDVWYHTLEPVDCEECLEVINER